MRTPRRTTWNLVLILGLLPAAACEGGPGGTPEATDSPPGEVVAVVDSILPVEEEIRRFLAALPQQVTELSGGEESRDALVARFVRSLEASDTADLVHLAMTRGEFGYLYYPFSGYTRPPYRLSPDLVWLQNRNQSDRGLTRLLARYAGHDMGFVSFECPQDPQVEGENRFWHYCAVRHVYQGDTVAVRLFGSVWERGGRFKLVGFANDL